MIGVNAGLVTKLKFKDRILSKDIIDTSVHYRITKNTRSLK